ncbi:hypothetical protein EI94DRAFT_1750304 [Lactarius quietus]|nr:hypothetical protein EI94DRAFT_1750304 [Lactarius quietus]
MGPPNAPRGGILSRVRVRRKQQLHRIEESKTEFPAESFLPADSSLETSNTANTSPSQQIHHSNSPFESSSTAKASFISTDSSESLQSYHTANASVSSLSTVDSGVSFPYTVTSINSSKSRKTVLYRRREHPPPVAISSQELSESTSESLHPV